MEALDKCCRYSTSTGFFHKIWMAFYRIARRAAQLLYVSFFSRSNIYCTNVHYINHNRFTLLLYLVMPNQRVKKMWTAIGVDRVRKREVRHIRTAREREKKTDGKKWDTFRYYLVYKAIFASIERSASFTQNVIFMLYKLCWICLYPLTVFIFSNNRSLYHR